jgi:two-component system, OmpR family, alkaline phosphatase synthesis response regulator PhoP
MSGTEVCRILRRRSDVPVLMITARSTEDDVVLGLDAGADDYVTKPYSPRELMARVRTLLRRTGDEGVDTLRVGPVEVDLLRHQVRIRGEEVETTPGEFRLLRAMADNAERALSRSQLLEHLHGDDRYVTTRTIDVHVMNLRRKIEEDPNSPVHLLTVYGVGYRLSAGPR